ncbi:hypothetical protein [Roseomonas sp. CECT 9278]|uniref:hypothetical protein n=1 Tax=Roseomonas sp. CECT 9278 TaxID=2845823 RepID=UPI001E473C8B|nr:hypothetical protein [Roseomonas sp. CECT 9278]CAH0311904.1 hypothetical protein ROS9278_04970 [Roseomonas sp. CECT 9278]
MTVAPSTPLLPVRRRLVLHVPGYEPLSAGAQQRRLARTLGRSAACWGLAVETGPGVESADRVVRSFPARLSGPDWATEAEIRILAWDDLIAQDLRVPLPRRILRGGAALARLLADGTLARYGAAHWRYLLFVALPLALLGGALVAGLLAGVALGGWAGVALGVALALGLVLLADRRAHLGHLFADWSFARDLADGTRPDIAARIARFAQEVAAARRTREVDEVVLTGHSLGMVLLAQALAAALAQDPDPPRPAPRLVLVGLGSSLLKIALMPAAGALRAAVSRIAAAPGLSWLEYTSRRDLVSFHRADPVAALRLAGRGPRMERIHPRAMLDAAGWRRVRLSMLRAHRIYLTGNGRRYFYDWGLIACGPAAVGRDPCPDRLIAADGSLRHAPQETAA